jgi:hypothetical protein
LGVRRGLTAPHRKRQYIENLYTVSKRFLLSYTFLTESSTFNVVQCISGEGPPSKRSVALSPSLLISHLETWMAYILFLLNARLFLQLLRIRPYGLFQSRNTSGIMNPFRHFTGLLGWVISPSQVCAFTGQHNTEDHGQTFVP